ncbi:MAG TPA: methyltransferase [Pilimelia sp.]|nr:methyltransferase [Pilimelia sp.]
MLLDAAGVDRLRAALAGASFTAAGVADRLGPAVVAAVGRNDHRAALRRTAGRDALDTLIRLFLCQQTEPADAVAAALAPLPLSDALAAGLVAPHGDGLRQGVDLEPYADDWWILSDVPAAARPGQPLPGDHVLGVGGASVTLAAATPRRPVRSALDLGTGCGVQALHLSAHADAVTATDVSDRALRFAATTAALNGLDWELLRGDLAAPVAGRRFDLVVSNPPFVVGPGLATHTYRDSGRAGDAVCAELAAAAPALLAPGGTMQFLANWLHVAGQDWGDRVAGWVAGTGLDAWVIQREVADPVAYVNLWLADAAEAADPGRLAAWLDWFDAHRVEAVGFGLVTLRAGGHADPVVRVEDLRQPVDGGLGGHVDAWFDRQDWLRRRDTTGLLAQRYRAAAELRLRQEATLGPEGWAVDRQVLELTGGLRWSEEIDPLVLALVGGCDGSVPLREQVTLLAAAHGVPEAELAEVAGPLAAHLVERGVLYPAAQGG